jgi:hypothetical protein
MRTLPSADCEQVLKACDDVKTQAKPKIAALGSGDLQPPTEPRTGTCHDCRWEMSWKKLLAIGGPVLVCRNRVFQKQVKLVARKVGQQHVLGEVLDPQTNFCSQPATAPVGKRLRRKATKRLLGYPDRSSDSKNGSRSVHCALTYALPKGLVITSTNNAVPELQQPRDSRPFAAQVSEQMERLREELVLGAQRRPVIRAKRSMAISSQ